MSKPKLSVTFERAAVVREEIHFLLATNHRGKHNRAITEHALQFVYLVDTYQRERGMKPQDQAVVVPM